MVFLHRYSNGYQMFIKDFWEFVERKVKALGSGLGANEIAARLSGSQVDGLFKNLL
jgi:hypothetical protein